MFRLMMHKVGILFAAIMSMFLFGIFATEVHNFFVEFLYGDTGIINASSRYLSDGVARWLTSDLAPFILSDNWYYVRVLLQVFLIPILIINRGKFAYEKKLQQMNDNIPD